MINQIIRLTVLSNFSSMMNLRKKHNLEINGVVKKRERSLRGERASSENRIYSFPGVRYLLDRTAWGLRIFSEANKESLHFERYLLSVDWSGS